MTTPAYTPFDPAKIDASTDGVDVPTGAQANDNALANELALLGMLGWNETTTYSGGKVAAETYAQGVYRVRVTYAYVASGPAAGAVDTETHEWSNDSGSTWAPRTDAANGVTAGVLTYSYDVSGNATDTTWS